MSTTALRRLLTAATTASVLTLTAALLSAAPDPAPDSSAAPDGPGGSLTGQELSETVLAMHKQGLSAVEIDRELERHGLDVLDPEAYDAATRSSAGLLDPMSGSGDVALSPPFIVHEEGARWYWMANYRWRNSDFSNDQTYSCRFYDRCKLPGRDGYGLYFDRRLDMRGYWSSFGHRSPSLPAARILDPWERNVYGVVYKKQDIVYRNSSPDDLNMYYGNITVEIHGRPCGTTNAWTKFAHTWGDRNLPDVNIGRGFLTFTFSGSGSKWQKVSQPGSNTRRC